MQSRTSEHTNTRNIKQIVISATLMAFTIMSSMPYPALAFESALAVSPAQKLVADVRVTRPGELSQSSQIPRTQAVIATANPVTEQSVAPIQVVAVAPVERVIPTLDNPVVLEGEASYYSRAGCLGCDPLMIMANGQPLDDNALTMAIGANLKHLVGYKARVTSLATGKSVVVTITDTGGFYQAKYGHRVADLTVATKQAIGMAGGVGQVRVEVF